MEPPTGLARYDYSTDGVFKEAQGTHYSRTTVTEGIVRLDWDMIFETLNDLRAFFKGVPAEMFLKSTSPSS
jgi:hypothetical protein